MSSFQSELGVQFGTSLEAPHVINVESQVPIKFLTFFLESIIFKRFCNLSYLNDGFTHYVVVMDGHD